MKILVFGKTGQVAQELQKMGGAHTLTCLGRDAADLTNPQTCADIITALRPHAVVNAAAFTAVDKAESEFAIAGIVNGEAPGAMARAAAALDIPFVHLSSDYVFDGSGTTPWRETDTVAPQNIYGATKLAGEIAVHAAQGCAVILRTSWVFSAHGSNFVKTMLRLSQTRPEISVVDDQIGGPTPASEIAKAVLRIVPALADGAKGGIYHFSGQPDTSWADFARQIFLQAGRAVRVVDIPTSAYPTPARRPLNSRLDCSALMRDFAIQRPDWHVGLRDTLRDIDPCKI